MRPGRSRLVRAIRYRIGATPVSHALIRAVLARTDYSLETRALSAAIIRTELEARSFPTRIIEYLYVALRLPGFRRVTVGPGQIAAVRLMNIAHGCACENGSCRPPGSTGWELNISPPSHWNTWTRCDKAMRRRASWRIAMPRASAPDRHLPTLYSEVVLAMVSAYQPDPSSLGVGAA